jgi:hypothetical protein
LPPVKNFIDQHVFANLKQIGVPPSPLCDDSTFLRRISLDIGGRLPTAEETKAFLASREPDKRDRAIEALLSSPDYADYFANKWTSLLKNTRADAADITSNFAFHAWMRDSLLANTKYDQIVRQILASTGTIVSNPPVAWYKRVKEPTTQLEDVAQLFLGVRISPTHQAERGQCLASSVLRADCGWLCAIPAVFDPLRCGSCPLFKMAAKLRKEKSDRSVRPAHVSPMVTC